MLDTSVAIHIRDGHSQMLARLESVAEPIRLSVVSWIKLESGVVNDLRSSALRRKALDQMLLAYPPVELGARDVAAYRQIVEALGFSRPKLLDRLIAAQALVLQARLATMNARDFQAVPELLIEDWSFGSA